MTASRSSLGPVGRTDTAWLASAVFAGLLPVTAGLGAYLVIPGTGAGQLNGFRVLVCLAFAALPLLHRGRVGGSPLVVWPVAAVGVVSVSWAFASVAWSPDATAGIAECTAIILGFGAILSLVAACRDRPSVLAALRHGWVVAYVICGAVAIWELRTGHHLVSSYVEQYQGSEMLTRFMALSTFGNPNNYGAFIAVAFPLLVWELALARSWVVRTLLVLLIVTAPVLLIITGARLSMVGVAGELFVLIAFSVLWNRRARRGLLALLLVAPAVLVLVAPYLRVGAKARSLITIATELHYGGSAGIRLNLLRDGWEMLRATWGIGTGAGSFSYEIIHGYRVYPV